MERIPKKAPLPCFGLDHNRHDPICQACPHFDSCLAHTGSRADKVPLNQVRFNLIPANVPEKFRRSVRHEIMCVTDRTMHLDDPEIPHLQRLYADCYYSVFLRNPTDNVAQVKDAIVTHARKAACSVRMYILANMMAHKVHEANVIKNTEKLRAAKFHAKLLAAAFSVKRAKAYQQMCHDEFGTFTLTSLAVLTESDGKDNIESTMLRSEVTAALWFVRYKIFNGGDALSAAAEMYKQEELQLAPEWLAIEKSYLDLILKPYVAKTIHDTEAVERHRFNVFQVHHHYKGHLSSQRLAFMARERIMPQAVNTVLNAFNQRPDDFLYPRIAVKDPLDFWQSVALTLRHYHCWLYLNGLPSYFTPRRNETLVALGLNSPTNHT